MANRLPHKRTMQQRLDESNSIALRFPKGGNDPLAGVKTLGNAFRSVNSLDFRLVKTGTMLPRK